ncbi:MAG: HAMP domain-containing sensor histidine kinase [Spirochaetota bacterium]
MRRYDNINIILTEGRRLTALINDVLDIAKMEAGKIDWKSEPLEAADLIENALNATASLFTQKGIKVIRKVKERLPVVIGDGDRLIQVMINLLSNAVKFTDEGSVTCAAKKTEEGIMISIIDTGVGISKGNHELVFEKFKQVGDTLTDKPVGTGLGLSICKQIVEHHGGSIWVESEPGKGSNFSFILPTIKDEVIKEGMVQVVKTEIDALIKQIREHVSIDNPDVKVEEKTILVVDDDSSIRIVL